MKKFIASIFALMLLGLFVLNTEAQETAEPLWLMGEEVVKPAMVEQYFELSKELVELCKTEKFPYSFYVWVSQPFHYSISYPIGEMNDITEIEKAWKAILNKLGEEKSRLFQDCIESQNDKVMVGLLNMSYLPEPPRLSDDEISYCYWQEVSVKKGSEKAVEGIFMKAIEIMKEKGIEMGTYIGKGKTGYDQPVYFAWYYGKDQMDFLEQEKKFGEQVGEEWKQINGEIIKHINSIRNIDFWYVKELSYQKEE
jgi:hypothetical protein